MARIEYAYTTNPVHGKIGYGDIRKFADSTRSHLSAAHRITNVLFVSGGPTEDAIDRLLRQLEVGLPAQALELINIPADLARGEYLMLFNAGIASPSQLWERSDQQISQLLGPLVGRLLTSRRPSNLIDPTNLVSEKSSHRELTFTAAMTRLGFATATPQSPCERSANRFGMIA